MRWLGNVFCCAKRQTNRKSFEIQSCSLSTGAWPELIYLLQFIVYNFDNTLSIVPEATNSKSDGQKKTNFKSLEIQPCSQPRAWPKLTHPLQFIGRNFGNILSLRRSTPNSMVGRRFAARKPTNLSLLRKSTGAPLVIILKTKSLISIYLSQSR
jgi:hypothetical protein